MDFNVGSNRKRNMSPRELHGYGVELNIDLANSGHTRSVPNGGSKGSHLCPFEFGRRERACSQSTNFIMNPGLLRL